MTLPAISYHAHLRRVKRIERAALSNPPRTLSTQEEFDAFFGNIDRWTRLEKLAWRQYNASRAKTG